MKDETDRFMVRAERAIRVSGRAWFFSWRRGDLVVKNFQVGLGRIFAAAPAWTAGLKVGSFAEPTLAKNQKNPLILCGFRCFESGFVWFFAPLPPYPPSRF